jgi:hypothetical protein
LQHCKVSTVDLQGTFASRFRSFLGQKARAMSSQALPKRLLDALKQAERGSNLIEGQKRIIAALKAVGVDTGAAEATLEAFERSQSLRLSEIEKIREGMRRSGLRGM